MRNLMIIFGIFLFPVITIAQINYNDVAVIINDSSSASLAIGNYFQQQRNIPSQNIIHIACPAIEETDSIGFEAIRQQVETALSSNNLLDSINYIVLTKGIPHRVVKDSCYGIQNFGNCTSLDAELSLTLSANSTEILANGTAINPYFGATAPFNRNNYDIFLVTRLDGYSTADVFDLIDRSGPNLQINISQSHSILDLGYVADSLAEFNIYDTQLQGTEDSLNLYNWPNTYHPDTAILSNQNNVIAYYAMHYQPENLVLNNSWLPGAIAVLAQSNSALTFDTASNVTSAIQLADLIREGASGACGSAAYISLSTIPVSNVLFNRYTYNPTNYNLAESYYASIPRLSWQAVVIGDPKTSLNTEGASQVQRLAPEIIINLYPNPSNGLLNIESAAAKIRQIEIYDLSGTLLKTQAFKEIQTIQQLDLSDFPAGVYFLRLTTNKQQYTMQRFVIAPK